MIKSVVIDFHIGESIGVISREDFFNRLSITFKVESVKSLTFNYK